MNAESHYDEGYFSRGKQGFEFSGWANVTKFSPFINPSDTVLDFGCSAGYMLDNIVCRRKIGVELNSVPRAIAASKGIEVHERTASVIDGCVDVVVSNHVLEHTISPLDELAALRKKLKPVGKIVLVVPFEGLRTKYLPNDKDFHLFTWSPLNLGNLLVAAGFDVIECKPYIHRWPPRIHRAIASVGGRIAFDFACRVYGSMFRGLSQVRAVAQNAP